MANPHRGEVALETADGTFHVLRYTVNSLCALEERLEMPIARIAALFEGADGISMRHLRAVLWAGLIDRQPDLTEAEAGRIMDDAGMAAVTRAIERAFTAAFPASEGRARGRPRKAAG